MDCPDNLDTFLRDLLKEEGGAVQLDDEDRAFIDRILKSITQGSKGVFVVLHPNDRMQYMLLNTNRAGAIALLAKVMQRTAEALEADLDCNYAVSGRSPAPITAASASTTSGSNCEPRPRSSSTSARSGASGKRCERRPVIAS